MEVFQNVLRLSIGRGVKGGQEGAVLDGRVAAEGLLGIRDVGAADLPTAAVAVEAGAVDGIEVGSDREVDAAPTGIRIGGIEEVTLAGRISLILDAGQVGFEGNAAEVRGFTAWVDQ